MKNKFIFSGLLAVALTVMSFAPVSAIETNTLKAKYTKAEGFVLPATEAPEAKIEALTQSQDIQDAFNAIYPGAKVPQGELVSLEDIQTFLAKFEMDTGYITNRGTLETCLMPLVENDDPKTMAIGAFKAGTVTLELTKGDTTYPLTFTVTPNKPNLALTPDNVTIKPGEEVNILVEPDWWIWYEDGATSLSIQYTFDGSKFASIKTLKDENGSFIGYTVTGKSEGTATLSIKSTDGKYSAQATINVKNEAKPTTPVKPETPASDDGEVLGESVSNKKPGVVQTSDNTNVILYSTALAASLIAIAGYTILRKKEN